MRVADDQRFGALHYAHYTDTPGLGIFLLEQANFLWPGTNINSLKHSIHYK